jgi:hypothetical protein
MSMLLAAALLAPQARPAPAPTPSAEEVVIVGERMRRLKLGTRTDRKTKAVRCVFKRRSGDAAFDALMCDALLRCARQVRTEAQMEACLAPTVSGYARVVAARRSAGN